MKHTPGPWTLGKGLYTVREQSATGRDGFIARTHIPGEWRARDEEEQQANARLIAAAPDLLAAIEAFPGFLADCEEGDKWIEQISAAVNKATGKVKIKITDLDTGAYYYASEPAECRPQHEEAFREANYRNIIIGNLKFERYEPTN